ncbi:protein-tyrosine-phosphatase [Acidipropionibacterium acidipropionici]|uniref:Protein-tyrosine-phosphatase n=1 Tax=Acidipropionibacterium acidipropionici TaxID=1748 RepID=A0ABM6FM49_9ACTN|nr:tyrosine-protein phosphatase [Acidipropionibacterium acidipropionici]AOZ47247.1 hypothetical protein A8L58_11785 [Acidipropionibacterium acidipropionici]AZP36643.1 protein-tyrosine-phosphatase [Acidipropionibacterium acidipropionici]
MTSPSETARSRRVPLPSAPNMRDLGGLPVSGGVVRTGVVFRSASLADLADEDQRALADLGIATVYDMRTAQEQAKKPDELPVSALLVPLDVLADDQGDASIGAAIMSGHTREVADLLEEGGAAAIIGKSYRKFIRLRSAHTAYEAFFRGLANPSRRGAALFHCATGKDRTGWAAVCLLRILGAEDDVILDDYLQTNADLMPTIQPVLDKAEADGVDPELVLPILTVHERNLAVADDEVKRVFGSFDAYLSEGLGLKDSTLEALRERFVE